jgi:hypothetical protein
LEKFTLKVTNVMMAATRKKPTINTYFVVVAPAWSENVLKASSSVRAAL